jgi:arylsulfatase A-like enzyme
VRTGRWIALSVVLVVGAAGWIAFQNYWYYIPGLLQSIRDPISPNHPVVWQKGPEVASVPAEKRPPNIVLILADDLGYNDITLNGGGVANGAVPTPSINSIAHDGVVFPNGYAGNATCAPSRAAIMTGRFATRFGFEFTPAPMQFEKLISTYHEGPHKAIFHTELEDLEPPYQTMAVPTSEITIAQLLKTSNYHTAFLGKWHLGETDAARPESRGFDEALGFLAGASLFARIGDPNVEESHQEFDPIDKFLWANLPFAVTNNRSHRFYPSEYMTDYLGDNAVAAINANRNRPFFLYLAFNAPHVPLQALKSDYDALSQIKDHRLRVYGAMVRALDRNIGHVLAALKANGLDKNTLVIFTSDNGGANYIGLPDINRPYRGFKATFFEGGIHVPFMMKWPAKIAPGTTYNLPVAHTDIFATVAAAAGAALPKDRVMDGVDLVSFVTGTAKGAPHRTLYWRSGLYKTVWDEGMKLQYDGRQNKVWLFDLRSDPTEHKNLAASQPDEVKRMMVVLNGIDKQQAKPLWPSLLEGPIYIDKPLSEKADLKPDDEYIYWAN